MKQQNTNTGIHALLPQTLPLALLLLLLCLPPSLAGAASLTIRPQQRSIGAVVFDSFTGLIGLPGLVENTDNFTPDADQGRGFHTDGTARQADGSTGTISTNTSLSGKRAATYARSGLGPSRSTFGSNNNLGDGLGTQGYDSVGYDPAFGYNWRLGNAPTLRNHKQGRDDIFGSLSPQQALVQRGIGYGMGLANSAVEGLVFGLGDTGYGGAKARLNFTLDKKGRVNGEGDLVLPLYDGQYTTVFTQLGTRSMSGISNDTTLDSQGAKRWIGNFGLGQRWYPLATNQGKDQDAGNWMFGYNLFFDNDFTRSHQRGGVGLELQYDWIKGATNYYAPLSGWEDSHDYNKAFVKERPAKGWDAQVKAYLPFYRNVAITGAYSQWSGDNVSMFSTRKLEKNPAVWSYGVEYTPFPLISAYVNQRATQRNSSDTEFGLRFTYTFAMPWDEQVSHSKVAETRTVGGSRHSFVDRENKLILEYQAKDVYNTEFIQQEGQDIFVFRVKNGLGAYAVGKKVQVMARNVTLLAGIQKNQKEFFVWVTQALDSLFSVNTAYAADLLQTYTTNAAGEIRIRIKSALAQGTLTLQVGESTQVFTPAQIGVSETPSILSASPSPQQIPSGVATNVAITLADSNSPATVQNKTVTLVYTGTGTVPSPPANATTDANGTFTVSLTGQTSGPVTITATLPDGRSVPCVVTVDAYTISFPAAATVGGFSAGQSTAIFIAQVNKNGVATAAAGIPILWAVLSADNSSNPAVTSEYAHKKTGLTWGAVADMVTSTSIPERTDTFTSDTDSSGKARVNLTDIVGERTVTVQASTTMHGITLTATQVVTYAQGPLGIFKVPQSQPDDWGHAYYLCNNSSYTAAPTTWTNGQWVGGSKMPTRVEIQSVSPIDTEWWSFVNPNSNAKGASHAAGWDSHWYWTGEASGAGNTYDVELSGGNIGQGSIISEAYILCKR